MDFIGFIGDHKRTVSVFDHDFPSLAEGVAIPHAVYDLARHESYVSIGTSRETSEFACDALGQWWNDHGKVHYPHARAILMLMDGGGSNSSRHYIFKQDIHCSFASFLGRNQFIFHEIGEKTAKNIFKKLYGW